MPCSSLSFSWKGRMFKSKYTSRYRRSTSSTRANGTRLSLGLPLRRSTNPEYPSASSRSRHRRMVRSVTPMISAASHHRIFFAIAFSNTSCSFIIRSVSAAEYCWLGSTPQLRPPPFQSLQIIYEFTRTDHILATIVGKLPPAADADGENTESKRWGKKTGHTNCVGSDRANGGEVEVGAGGGPAVPSGFLRVSPGEVGAGCSGAGAQAMLAL